MDPRHASSCRPPDGGCVTEGTDRQTGGDGEGRNSVWLAEQGHDVAAWDASKIAVEKAKGLAEARGVSVNFVVEDAASYDWSLRQHDVVVAIITQFARPYLRDKILGV